MQWLPRPPRTGRRTGDARAGAAARTPGQPRSGALVLPRPALGGTRHDDPSTPGHTPDRRSRGEQRIKVKVGARLPPASLHPPRPRPRLRPPHRASHRPSARLSAARARFSASLRSVLPEVDRSRRLPLAPPLPPGFLRLPLTPASGQEEAS